METAIEYPKISLDGQAYEVRFRIGDIIRLKKEHGLVLGEHLKLAGDDGLENAMKVLSAGLAHAIILTPEQIADKIDLASFGEVIFTVIEAMGKVSDRSKALLIEMSKRIPVNPVPEVKPN